MSDEPIVVPTTVAEEALLRQAADEQLAFSFDQANQARAGEIMAEEEARLAGDTRIELLLLKETEQRKSTNLVMANMIKAQTPTFIQPDKPTHPGPYLWIQTGMGLNGAGMTFHVHTGD